MPSSVSATASPRPALATHLERRHDERGIAAVRLELARRKNTRVADVRIRAKRRAQAESRSGAADVPPSDAVEVHMRPRPFLSEHGEDVRRVAQRWSARTTAMADPVSLLRVELGVLEHDQHDPRRQAMRPAVGRERRIAPRKVLVVEVDRGEVVRLEVRDCPRAARCGSPGCACIPVMSPGPRAAR